MVDFFPSRRTLLLALLLAALVPIAVAPAQSLGSGDAPPGPPLQVALVADTGPTADSLRRHVQAETQRLFAGSAPVRFERVATLAAASDSVDALVAVGPQAIHTACASARDVPVFGVSTGSGLLAPASSEQCTIYGSARGASAVLEAFQTVAPFDTLAVAVDARAVADREAAAKRLQRRGRTVGVEARLVPFTDTLDPTRIAGADAVLLDHADRLSSASVSNLARTLTERGLPLFTLDATAPHLHGALAAQAPNLRLRARQVALDLEALVHDTPPSSVSPAAPDARLVINERVAAVLDVALPLDVRVRARLVGTAPPDAPAFTLSAAMRESMARNLSLQAERQRVAASANRLDRARAQLMPQVTASATGQTVNDDLAAASFGSQPERQITSALSMRQVLFSEPAVAAYSVERKMQAMREFERQSTRLDAAEDAATAYLNVLRARARQAIQRENVETVRTNLDAARARQRTGQADPREVSRLKTSLARAERGWIDAQGAVRAAEIQFNRVLDRPLDAPVVLDRTAGVDPAPLLERFPYADLLDTPRATDAFTSFWVTEARQHAPEVRAVDQLVRARERQLTSARRSFWMPTISLNGSLSQRMYEGGAGTTGLTLPLSEDTPTDIPRPPDQQWSLGLTASIPLFEGTDRLARQRQAADELAASKTERMIAHLGVEQRVRTALVNLETAHAAVERAQRAADAAQHTLDVTQAAYREGTASLLDLIDAQNSALSTRLDASNAAYDLLLDWMAVQRAGGSFRALRTPQEQSAFQSRLMQRLPQRRESDDQS